MALNLFPASRRLHRKRKLPRPNRRPDSGLSHRDEHPVERLFVEPVQVLGRVQAEAAKEQVRASDDANGGEVALMGELYANFHGEIISQETK